MASIAGRLGIGVAAVCASLALVAPASGAVLYQPRDVVLPTGVFFPTGMSVDEDSGSMYVGGDRKSVV